MQNTILIVEDGPHISGPLSALLNKQGYNCYLARSASEAIIKYKNHKTSLILLDLAIPGEHGTKVAAKIKKLANTQEQPIIIGFSKFYNQRNDDDIRWFALNNGINEYISDYKDKKLITNLVTMYLPLTDNAKPLINQFDSLETTAPTINEEQPPLDDNNNSPIFKCNIL